MNALRHIRYLNPAIVGEFGLPKQNNPAMQNRSIANPALGYVPIARPKRRVQIHALKVEVPTPQTERHAPEVVQTEIPADLPTGEDVERLPEVSMGPDAPTEQEMYFVGEAEDDMPIDVPKVVFFVLLAVLIVLLVVAFLVWLMRE